MLITLSSMPKLFVAAEDHVFVVEQSGKEWQARAKLRDRSPDCIAADPSRPARLYCGTFGHGLWLTDDFGTTWKQSGKGVINPQLTSVAVSPTEKKEGFGVVYVGTEPSELYRSQDGGETWRKPADLLDVPSSSSWSFPPKPDTHHVRYISTDPVQPGRIYLAIEAGALLRSFDGGKTWKDRVDGGPYDTHTLATNPNAPGSLYSSAGDGYFESRDYGETWRSPEDGLRHHYLYSVTVHPSDPDTVLISASSSAWTAYNPQNAESYIYRRGDRRNWERVVKGLPPSSGTTASALSANPEKSGEFYAANNTGLYRSSDTGFTWEKLLAPWPGSNGTGYVTQIAVVNE